ncbi:MAG: two-component system response regulator [Paraglaciecola sp.]|uniref:HD-GYP domain-containing protein n=1 Tax=Paraglaciecola sp. TaxID=1920173 RepID=UPI003299615D
MDRKIILAVDDTPGNINVVKSVLSEKYSIMAAINGALALKIVEKQRPDLILLDIMMPEMDGYEVCQKLKANPSTRDIPIIFLTAKSEIKDEAKGLELGAIDYITKPFSPAILAGRVKNHLALKEAQEQLAQQNSQLEQKVVERTMQMEELQDVAMVSMGALAESRDPETGNHIRRTQYYVKLMAEELSKLDKFKDFLTPENITMLYKSAPLHDIGKVGIPDSILLKPGKLTEAEFEVMKLHPTFGHDAIESAIRTMNSNNNFLRFAKEIAYGHHEKWDGSGYPQGLSGDDIPVSSRLMALADVYDALISKRVYKPAFPHEKAVAIIEQGKGSHFDPEMVEAFLRIQESCYATAQKYADD